MPLRFMRTGAVAAAVIATAAAFTSGIAEAQSFSQREADGRLYLYDGGDPVLVYNFGPMAPAGMDEAGRQRYRLSCYIHPLYGPDGDVLTQQFPSDHYHHRGVFWAWTNARRGDRPADIWHVDGVRQVFGRWREIDVSGSVARLTAENGWKYDDEDAPFVREVVSIRVHPMGGVGRAIDFHLRFENVSRETVTIRGQGERGYGGFGVRPDAERSGRRITTALGFHPEDVLEAASPWADYSLLKTDGDGYSGVAIFQHPENAGPHPHPGWILRYYGFLGASYPYFDEIVLAPEGSFELRYRLYVHRGDAGEGRVSEAYEAFVAEVRAR
jgi:hypothetical protein